MQNTAKRTQINADRSKTTPTSLQNAATRPHIGARLEEKLEASSGHLGRLGSASAHRRHRHWRRRDPRRDPIRIATSPVTGPRIDLGSFCAVLHEFGVVLRSPATMWGRFAPFCNDLGSFCAVLQRCGVVLRRSAAIWCRFALFCNDLVTIFQRVRSFFRV